MRRERATQVARARVDGAVDRGGDFRGEGHALGLQPCRRPARSSNGATGGTWTSMKPLAAALVAALAAVALAGCRDRAPGQTEPSVVATSGASELPASGSAHAIPGGSVEPLPPSAAPAAVPFVSEKVTGEGHAMGTHLAYAAFTTPTLDAAHVHALFDAATAEIVRLEKLMTTWDPASEVSRVNAAAGKEASRRQPGDLRGHPRSAPRQRDQRRDASTSPSRRSTGSGSSTRTSTPTRRPRRPCTPRPGTSATST